MRPVWFLDVDGVVSPFGITGRWPDARLYPGPPDSDLTVPYRTAIVDAIARLHQTGVVEVRWLTTWDPTTLTAWHDIGLGPFTVATPVQGRRRWWKANVVAHWLDNHPAERAIWTDDDLTPSRRRGFDHSRLLSIAPRFDIGLTYAHLDRIEDWLDQS